MRTGAVDELAAGRVVLLIGHDQRQQGDRLARARRHLQHAISAGIERLCGRLASGRPVGRRPSSAPRPYSSSPPCSCRATPFHVSMIGSAGPRGSSGCHDVRILLWQRVSGTAHGILRNGTCLGICADREREQAGRCRHLVSHDRPVTEKEEAGAGMSAAYSMLNSILGDLGRDAGKEKEKRQTTRMPCRARRRESVDEDRSRSLQLVWVWRFCCDSRLQFLQNPVGELVIQHELVPARTLPPEVLSQPRIPLWPACRIANGSVVVDGWS